MKEMKREEEKVKGEKIYEEIWEEWNGEEGKGKRKGVVGEEKRYEFKKIWGKERLKEGDGMKRII